MIGIGEFQMDVKIYSEPIEILSELSGNKSQMSDEQLAYICGLIKMYMPKKIVEVGVADGGTTAVILNCIDKLRLDSEIHSIEISTKSPTDWTKKAGYLSEECKALLDSPIRHELNIGVLPDYIEKIGEGIDFLILDTTHRLPGELLDFLVALPYLHDNAIVVMHDIWLNQWEGSTDSNQQATRVLLSTTVGERLVSQSMPLDFNIGAFMVTADTRKYVANVFQALALTWRYIPDDNYLNACRKCYMRYYSEELVQLYDAVVEKNKATRKRIEERYQEALVDIFDFVKQIPDEGHIYIYGAGVHGKNMRSFLQKLGKKVWGYVISDGQKKVDLDIPVYYLSEAETQNSIFILAVNEGLQREICEMNHCDKLIIVKSQVLQLISGVIA